LFDWALPFAGPGTKWVLPKGVNVDAELAIASERFAFDYELITSRTDAAARIVVARGVKRR
jgi:16S rRNA (guanine527-N7)-methyltransferase